MQLETRRLGLTKDRVIKLAGSVALLSESEITKLYADIISWDSSDYLYAKNSPLLKKILESLEAALCLRIRQRIEKELFPAKAS